LGRIPFHRIPPPAKAGGILRVFVKENGFDCQLPPAKAGGLL